MGVLAEEVAVDFAFFFVVEDFFFVAPEAGKTASPRVIKNVKLRSNCFPIDHQPWNRSTIVHDLFVNRLKAAAHG